MKKKHACIGDDTYNLENIINHLIPNWFAQMESKITSYTIQLQQLLL